MILHNWRLTSRLAAWVLCLAFSQIVSGQVTFNEILFYPPPAVPENPAAEWLELYNRGSLEINVNGWRISKGVSFAFTNVVIPAGGYLVVAAVVDMRTFTISNRLNLVVALLAPNTTRADAALGWVRAKTGTLTGVHGLAGVVTARDGSVMLFVAIADRVKVRHTMFTRDRLDQIAAALADCRCAR